MYLVLWVYNIHKLNIPNFGLLLSPESGCRPDHDVELSHKLTFDLCIRQKRSLSPGWIKHERYEKLLSSLDTPDLWFAGAMRQMAVERACRDPCAADRAHSVHFPFSSTLENTTGTQSGFHSGLLWLFSKQNNQNSLLSFPKRNCVFTIRIKWHQQLWKYLDVWGVCLNPPGAFSVVSCVFSVTKTCAETWDVQIKV